MLNIRPFHCYYGHYSSKILLIGLMGASLVITVFSHPQIFLFFILDFCSEVAESIWEGWVERSGETEREQAWLQIGPHHQGEVRVNAMLSVNCRGQTWALRSLITVFSFFHEVLCDKRLFVSKHCCENEPQSLSTNRSVMRNLKQKVIWNYEYDTLINLAGPSVL